MAPDVVRDFATAAFHLLGLDWQDHVKLDERYLRPTDVAELQGDATKARRRLDWAPKVGFDELVKMMVDHDLDLARQEATLRDAGHDIGLRQLKTR